MIGERITVGGRAVQAVKLLGKGKAGYSYLAESDGGLVVLKKMHDEPCDYFQLPGDKLAAELKAYEALKNAGIPVPELLAADTAAQCLLKAYIEGDTLAAIVGQGALSPRHLAQMFAMCRKLYPIGLNIDYFPTNFVLRGDALFYVDYEVSPYADEWNFENRGIYFLANTVGMGDFLNTGDHARILENGKPIKAGFEEIVAQWVALLGHKP